MKKSLLEKILREVRSIENVVPPREQHAFDLLNLAEGMIIRIALKVYKVLEKGFYKEGDWDWIEYKLFSFEDGSTVYLEVEDDDELELTFYDTFPVLNDLDITEHDLEDFADDDEGEFEYNEKDFYYEDCGRAVYKPAGETKSLPFYYWEFEDSSGELFMTVEKWGDEYDASLGYEVDAHDVALVAKGS